MKDSVTSAAGYYYLLEEPNEAEDVGGEEAEDVTTLIVQGGITAVYLKQKLLYSVGREILDRSWIIGGSDGLTVLGSRFPDDDGNLESYP